MDYNVNIFLFRNNSDSICISTVYNTDQLHEKYSLLISFRFAESLKWYGDVLFFRQLLSPGFADILQHSPFLEKTFPGSYFFVFSGWSCRRWWRVAECNWNSSGLVRTKSANVLRHLPNVKSADRHRQFWYWGIFSEESAIGGYPCHFAYLPFVVRLPLLLVHWKSLQISSGLSN